MTDREQMPQLGVIAAALERQAAAAEALLEIAKAEQITMEYGPSMCPGCGKVNPTVTALSQDGEGPLDDWVFMGETHCCNKTLYAVPFGWHTTVNPDEAAFMLNERKGGK